MQLEFWQIFSQIVAFLIMLYILKRYAWQPLLNILDQRRKKIEAEFALIEERKKEAQELLDAYHNKLSLVEKESKDKIHAAEQEGEKRAQVILHEAEQRAQRLIDKGRADIVRESTQAQAALKSEVVNLAIEISEKILKEQLKQSEQEQLAQKYVEQLEWK
jgi:F-type H+-transporting ATPase subunit b